MHIVILMMRTWAIWEQSKWVSGLLLAELLVRPPPFILDTCCTRSLTPPSQIGLGIDIYVVHKYLFGVTSESFLFFSSDVTKHSPILSVTTCIACYKGLFASIR